MIVGQLTHPIRRPEPRLSTAQAISAGVYGRWVWRAALIRSAPVPAANGVAFDVPPPIP